MGNWTATPVDQPQPTNSGAGGGWSATPVDTAPPTNTGTQPTEDHVDDWLSKHPVLGFVPNLLAGAGAGVEQTAAGLDKLARQATGHQGEDWLTREAAKPTHGTVQAVGKGAESVGEFFTGEEMLGMLGRTGMAMSAADKLKNATQIASLLNKSPYLAKVLKIGMETVKAGTLGAGQEYVKTGGDESAAEGTGIVTGAGTAALGGAGLAGKALLDLAPVQRVLEGVNIPGLVSQIGKSGRFIEGGDISDVAPEIAQQQQKGAFQVLKNVAAKATRTALDGLNETRAVMGPVEAPGGPPPTAPFRFTMGGVEAPEAEAEGRLLQRAAPIEHPATVPGEGPSPQEDELGPLAATVPGRMLEAPRIEGPQAWTRTGGTAEQQSAQMAAQGKLDQQTIEDLGIKKAQGKRLTADERTQLARAQARNAISEKPPATTARADTSPGGGALTRQTNSPAEATSWLQDLEDVRRSPDYRQMSPAQRENVDKLYNNLRDQLSVYHASPYRNHFAPIDTDSVVGQVNTFGQGAAQIKAAVQPIFNRANELSQGAMDDALAEVETAKTRVTNANTSNDLTAAQQALDAAHDKVDNLLNAHASGLKPNEMTQAKQAWGQAKRLDSLHANFERMMNGVTDEQAQTGLQRVMTGNARDFGDWLAEPGNRKALDNMIGSDSRDNLTELTQLMSKVPSQRHTAEAAKNIAWILSKQNLGHIGVGALAMHAAGIEPGTTAMILGGVQGMRWVMRQAATNPSVGNMLRYAVSHNIRPDIYAPLISRTIAESLMGPAQPEQPATPGEAQGGTE